MRGSHTIKLWNSHIKYEFTIRRQISIIRGNSGTGKTTLISMVDQLYNYGKDSGIHLECDVDCVTLQGRGWKSELEKIRNSIIFIDEGSRFISSKEFASSIENSSNYFVIASRDKLENLPYSINCIFGIRESGKYGGLNQVYNEVYTIYDGMFGSKCDRRPTKVITEDSKSGYQFFKEVGIRHGFSCESANGKSNIDKKMTSRNKEYTMLVVDGAAFGPNMGDVAAKLRRLHNYILYAPESFEWMILKSGVLGHIDQLKDILECPEDYIDSSNYFSWERFFTDLLLKVTEGKGKIQYSKSKLPEWYTREDISDRILGVIKGIIL